MLYLLLRGAQSPGIVRLFLLVIAFELYFAYGVLVNDFFDRQVDREAGKASPKRGHALSEKELTAVLAFQLFASALVIAAIGGGVLFDLLWVVAFGLATMYSAPPARLRAKGFVGFLADSVIEKPLPILITFSLFGYYGFETFLFPVCGELLDSIFKHQVDDFDSDSRVGVRTLAVVLGKERSIWSERWLINPLDALAVVLLFLVSFVELPKLRVLMTGLSFLVFVGLIGFFLLARRGRVRQGFPFPEPPLVGYLNFAFRVVLLGGLALALAVQMPGYIPLAILVEISIVVYLKGHAKLIPDFFRYVVS